MDKLTRYRSLIKYALKERAALMRSQPLSGEEIVCLLSEETDNYLLLRLGWLQSKRLYSVTLHVRLTEAQIHIEQDWTDDFLSYLLDEGVCRDDIVLAFTPPAMRNQEDFVVVR